MRTALLCLAVALLALAAPVARASAAAVPLIVDTDMFSDADDVGALATAFGLQNLREAQVVAVTVDTPTSRPSVARSSWRCVAAIASFYGSSSVPIGTAMPNTGSSAGDAGFATPCAALAPASTPAPDTAVDVYRRALAAQPDGSVVIASVGYLGNLSALLGSPPDAISPLSGPELVAQKVSRLVVMGGGYPSRAGETNLGGDPASAQDVAAHWPTKVVWSGFEVGAGVLTGQTISAQHPAGSPVRVAYEAFAGRGTAISSWDPTAVYHAVRPDDALLHEVGPGTNAVASTGANTFTTGAGHQFYLQRAGSAAVASAIEKLLDRLEPLPPPAPPPPDPATSPRAEPPPPAADAQAAPAAPAVAPAARATGPGCVVPTLSGRTLEGARALLRRHRCALGRVTRAKGRTRLRVARQSLVPRRPHRAGTRVAITLR